MSLNIDRTFIERYCRTNKFVELPLWIKYKNHWVFLFLSVLFGILGCFLACISVQNECVSVKILLFICGLSFNLISSVSSNLYEKMKHRSDSYENQFFNPYASALITTASFSLFSALVNMFYINIILIAIGFIFFYLIPTYIERT